jgi:tetratricopeptide (TPR) repeat protein
MIKKLLIYTLLCLFALANGSALAFDNKSVLINRLIETENLLLREQVGKETHLIKNDINQLSKDIERSNQEIEKFQDQVNASISSSNDRIDTIFERYDSYFSKTMTIMLIILSIFTLFIGAFACYGWREVNKKLSNIAKVISTDIVSKEISKYIASPEITNVIHEYLKNRVHELQDKGNSDKITEEEKKELAKEISLLLNMTTTEKQYTAEDWFYIGLNHDKNNNFKKAENAYKKAIELRPNFYEPWNNLGLLYIKFPERIKDAVYAFKKTTEINPDNFEAWMNLGNIYTLQSSKFTEAERAYNRALEIKPNSLELLINIGNFYSKYPSEFHKAENAYNNALKINPNSYHALLYLGDLYANDIDKHMEAEKAYKTATNIKEDCYEAWNNLGALYLNSHQKIDDSKVAFDKSLEINPNYSMAWSNLGLYYIVKQEYFKAIVAFEKAIMLNPNSFESRLNLGILYATKCKRYDDAEKELKHAIDINEHFLDGKKNLYLLYLLANKNISNINIPYKLDNNNQNEKLFLDFFTILFNARDGNDVVSAISKFKENYKNREHLYGINRELLETGNLSPESIANIEKALKVFKEHNSTLNAN